MAAETFSVVFESCNIVPSKDVLAAIYNAEDTDCRRYFEVTSVVIRTPSGWGNTIGTSLIGQQYQVQRITAHSGGFVLPAIERDTGSTALPSQVVALRMPTSLTLTDSFRRMIAAEGYFYLASTNQWTSSRVYGGCGINSYQRIDQGSVWYSLNNSPVERIVLREGEGIALSLASFGQPRSGEFNLVVRNTSSGATYQFRSDAVGTPGCVGQGVVSLLNGAGSGVILEVAHIEWMPNGETTYPGFRLAKIDKIIDAATTVTPIANDTSHSAPAALQCSGGSSSRYLWGWGNAIQYDFYGSFIGVTAQQNIATLRRKSDLHPFFNMSGNTPGIAPGQDANILFEAKAGSGIILRQSEGLALLAGRVGNLDTSTFAYFNVEMTVLHYPPPTGGGGNTYSRGRVVNASG